MNLLVLVVLVVTLRTAAMTVGPCSMTMPTQSVHLTPDCPGNYGGDGLWVGLPEDGTIVFRPGGAGFYLPDGSLAWKFAWCKKVRGKLTISGQRLDVTAAPLRSSFNGTLVEKGFVPSHLIFPTSGCWQVTGRAGPTSLTFIVRVVRDS